MLSLRALGRARLMLFAAAALGSAPAVCGASAAADSDAQPTSTAMPWQATDLTAARETAIAQDARLVAVFTEPDCPSCARMLEDLAAVHRASLPRNLIYALMDRSADPDPAWRRECAILDFPTAIVFAPSGEELDRAVGYDSPETWRLTILRAASGTDPLPALLHASEQHDLHATYEAGWRLLARGRVEEGEELLHSVYAQDDANRAAHTAPALRLLARHAEEIQARPRAALTYWKRLLEEHYDEDSHAEALSALLRLCGQLGETDRCFDYLAARLKQKLDDRNRLSDLSAYAERSGHGTLETATLLRESFDLSPRDETASLLIRLLLSEGRVWEAQEQVRGWRQGGWDAAVLDSLEQQVTAAGRRAEQSWDRVHDTPPQVETQVPPECPASATAIGAAGQVVIKARVSDDGRVLECTVHRSSGVSALDGAAIDAVAEWTFRPAKRDGKAVAAEILVPLRFDCR